MTIKLTDAEARHEELDLLLKRKSCHDALGMNGDMSDAEREFESMRVIFNAYGWTIGADGRIYGLVRGDQGFEETHIQLDPSDIDAMVQDKCDALAITRAGGFAAAAARAVSGSRHKRPGGEAWDMPTPIGDYQIFERHWVDFLGVSHICENMDCGLEAARKHYVETIVSCLRDTDAPEDIGE